MKFDELVAQVLPIMPDAIFDEGINGEVIIVTGLRLVDGNLERL